MPRIASAIVKFRLELIQGRRVILNGLDFRRRVSNEFIEAGLENPIRAALGEFRYLKKEGL